jgi:hypothetical protein
MQPTTQENTRNPLEEFEVSLDLPKNENGLHPKIGYLEQVYLSPETQETLSPIVTEQAYDAMLTPATTHYDPDWHDPYSPVTIYFRHIPTREIFSLYTRDGIPRIGGEKWSPIAQKLCDILAIKPRLTYLPTLTK